MSRKAISLNSLLPRTMWDKCTPPGNLGHGGAESLSPCRWGPQRRAGLSLWHSSRVWQAKHTEPSHSPGVGQTPLPPHTVPTDGRTGPEQAVPTGGSSALLVITLNGANMQNVLQKIFSEIQSSRLFFSRRNYLGELGIKPPPGQPR